MQKRNYLKFDDRLKIYDFLKTICTRNGEYAEYTHGWNDVNVAKHLGVKPANIAGIRLSQFGKLRDRFLDEGDDWTSVTKDQMITILHENIGAQLTMYKDLEKRLAYIEKELGVTFK